MYSNTSQTRGSKLAKFSNSRFRSLLFTSRDLQTRGTFTLHPNSRFLVFLSPKKREFGGTLSMFYKQLPFHKTG